MSNPPWWDANCRRIVPLVIGVGLVGLTARADPLDDTITALMAKRHIAGLSLAVFQDGKIIKSKGYGIVGHGRTTPVDAGTPFQAGSVSKCLAALGALRLVETGKLSLDAPVNERLVSWQIPGNEFTAEKKVTLRELLSHTAGMSVHGFGGYAAGTRVPTLQQVLDGQPPANSPPIRVTFLPGSKWQYSGGGYTVVQQLMIDVSGQAFPDYMQQHVLDPLGMTGSSYARPASMTRPVMIGHTYPEMAAAGLWTTPSDLARFAMALQDALDVRGQTVISQAVAAQMLTEQKKVSPNKLHLVSYGLGMFLSGQGSTARFEHGGRNDGFDTQLTAYLKTRQGAVIMINANDNTHTLALIMEAIADAYGWKDFPHD